MQSVPPEDEQQEQLAIEGEIVDSPGIRNKTARLRKRLQVWDLFLQGYDYYEIGTMLGISFRRAAKIVQSHYRKTIESKVDEYRKLERARLNKYLVYLQPHIQRGAPIAIQTAVRISESLRKLDNVDAAGADGVEESTPELTTALRDMITRAKERRAELGSPNSSPNATPEAESA